MGNATENTRERILTAALELFAREGYDAVGVARIAAAVGIKAPSLYKHYRGKRDIFEHVLQRMEALDAEAAEACGLPTEAPGSDPEGYARAGDEELAAFTRRQFRFWTEDRFASAFRRMLTVEQYRSEEMAALYRAHLGAGPLEYVAELLGSREEAARFYGPMHLLYAVHDAEPGGGDAARLLEAHLEKWLEERRGKGRGRRHKQGG
ncbi:MAG: TetR/AcrR family transcriptional regulator [Kiritimatiellae bacterium]|nr:TetR/AcrR family transcriptional regulator [Kiritimatiellia bacterium]